MEEITQGKNSLRTLRLHYELCELCDFFVYFAVNGFLISDFHLIFISCFKKEISNL